VLSSIFNPNCFANSSSSGLISGLVSGFSSGVLGAISTSGVDFLADFQHF